MKKKKSTGWIITVIIGALFIGGLILLFAGILISQSVKEKNVCETVECFMTKANSCHTIAVKWTEDIGLVEYTAVNCEFTKKILEVNEEEPQEMKDILTGKSVRCAYERGNFNKEWLTSLVFGLEECEGELKETIGQLLLFTI